MIRLCAFSDDAGSSLQAQIDKEMQALKEMLG